MSNTLKKISAIGLSLTTAVWLSGAAMALPVAQGATVEELQAQISALLAQIQSLQSQLGSASGSSSVSVPSITRDLTLGSTGADVKSLQVFLNAQGYTVAASGVGSAGNETEYFGSLTQAALAKFQAAKGISPAAGYFGSITRSYMSSMASGSTGGSVVIPGTSYLTVTADGPAVYTIPDQSIYNPVLKLKFSAGSTEQRITGVTVTRGGFIANTNISGVSVWDEMGNRYGNIVTALTADGKATVSFSGTPFVVPAGQTKTLIVRANIADSGSATVNFSVASASDISVASGSSQPTGTFPLTGNVMTIVDGASSLGNLWVSSATVAGSAYGANGVTIAAAEGNVEIGDTEREIFKLRLNQNNSYEAVKIEKVVLYVEGTIQEQKDVTNWKLYSPEGNVLATANAPVDRYVTFNLATPYVLDKGLTKDFPVKADITEGSGNYFRVYVMNDYDIVARGVTTNAGLLILGGGGSTLAASDTQQANGGFKVKAGGLTVSKAPLSPSGSVAPSAQNIVLAKYDLKSAGEELQIQRMGIQVAYAGVALTGTLTVRDAATSETYLSISATTGHLQESDGSISSTTLLTYRQNLSSYIYLASGQTKSIEVVGTVASTATSTSNYTASIGNFYAKRVSTNDYATLAASKYDGNNLSVQDVSLSVTKSLSFPNTNRAKGSANVQVGEFTIQASDADDIRVNSLSFTVASSSYIQNLKLMVDGAQLGSTIGTPAASGNAFSINLTVPKSTTKIVKLYADVLSSATENDEFVISVTQDSVSGYGVTSSKSLSNTPASSNLELQTIGVKTGALAIGKDPSTPVSKAIVAGLTGVELSKINFEATNENLTLKKITLSVATPSDANPTGWMAASTTLYGWAADTDLAKNFSKIYLYDGSTLLNAGGTSLSGADAVISGLNLTLNQGEQKVLTVKADVNAESVITPKSVVGIQVKSSSTTAMEVYSSQGLMATGITLNDSNALSNYHLVTVATPEVTAGSAVTPVQSGSAEVGRFTITNSGTRNITLATATVVAYLIPNGATSSVNTFKLYESSDPSTLVSTGTGDLNNKTAATSTNVTFGTFSPSQIIAAGSSKTYIVKADTSAIKQITSTFTGQVQFYLKLNGAKGYSSSDNARVASVEDNLQSEKLWNAGVIQYQYTTTAATPVTYSSLDASDSGEVFLPTLTY
jgi:hypothetical protein